MEMFAVIAALIIGIGITLLLNKSRLSAAVSAARQESLTEVTSLQERLASGGRALAEANQKLAQAETEKKELQNRIIEISSARAAAEQLNERIPALENELKSVKAAREESERERAQTAQLLASTKADLENERLKLNDRMSLLQDAQARLSEAFSALSSNALKENNKTFLETAQALMKQQQNEASKDFEQRQKSISDSVAPLKESLEKVDKKIQDLESARISAYSSLSEHLRTITNTSEKLQNETSQLVKALRQPVTRGRWGEIQLRRVVEMAGMVDYCDFAEQESVDTPGGRLRPDMIIKLPNQKIIIVDSKTPLQAYIEAYEAQDDTQRQQKLKEHAVQIKTHINQLSTKQYWDQFDQTPEFVVLFLPGESFFSAALEQDQDLIEYGVQRKVILANPTTLIALLKAVAYGWRQEQIAQNAQEISKLGKELYERITKFAEYMLDMRKSITSTVDTYNKAVGSLESRVLVTARKFKELGTGSDDDIEQIESIDRQPRDIQKLD